MRYHECISNKNWQDSTLNKVMGVGGAGSLLAVYLVSRNRAANQVFQELGLILLKQIQRLPSIRL